MTFKASEDAVRKAFDTMDLDVYAYKPPDNPGPRQNWKPCDFMVWFADSEPPAMSVWIEVKDTPGVKSCATSLWRPTQIAGMRRAAEIGLPYLVVIRWSKLRVWTIGLAATVLRAIEDSAPGIPLAAWPIQCTPGLLPPHLRAALMGEL